MQHDKAPRTRTAKPRAEAASAIATAYAAYAEAAAAAHEARAHLRGKRWANRAPLDAALTEWLHTTPDEEGKPHDHVLVAYRDELELLYAEELGIGLTLPDALDGLCTVEGIEAMQRVLDQRLQFLRGAAGAVPALSTTNNNSEVQA